MADAESIFSGSVGASLAGMALVDRQSALYSHKTAQLMEVLRGKAHGEVARQVKARQVVVPFYVSPEAKSRCSGLYPELGVVAAGIRPALHPEFELERMLALEYARATAENYADTVVVLGDCFLNVCLAGSRNVHMEVVSSNADAMHANYQACQDFIALSGETGEGAGGPPARFVSDAKAYNDWLFGTHFGVCCDPGCGVRSKALVVDGTMYPTSRYHFVHMMRQSGAEVGFYNMLYNPVMFEHRSGFFPDMDVGYHRDGGEVKFMYTEGNVGAPVVAADVWHEWLAKTYMDVCGERYVFELRALRGSVLQVMVTKTLTAGAASGVATQHALEMPWASGKVQVRWKKLRSVEANPGLESSWVPVVWNFDRVLYDKLLLHCLALEKDQFTNALQGMMARMQRGADGKVIFRGMHTMVVKPIPEEDAVNLVAVVFAKAFVTRYEMNKLSAELMSQLASAKLMAKAGTAVRLWYVLSQSVSRLASGLSDFLFSGFREWLETRKALWGGKPGPGVLEIADCPQYLLYEDAMRPLGVSWRRWLCGKPVARNFIPGSRGARLCVAAAEQEDWECLPVCVGRAVPDVLKPVAAVVVRSPAAVLDVVEIEELPAMTPAGVSFVAASAALDSLSSAIEDRFRFDRPVVPPVEEVPELPVNFVEDPTYISTINSFHERVLPLAEVTTEQDEAQLAYQGQEWLLQGHMEMPLETDPPPAVSKLFRSKLVAYNVAKWCQTKGGTLLGVGVRNLATPYIAEPVDQEAVLSDVWENFLRMACLPDVRERLAAFREDTVGFEKEVLAAWTVKAQPGVLERLAKELVEFQDAVDNKNEADYMLMLKADAKPPMSTKPLRELVAPQVIAYQDKHLSALYSSVFRVLTRRFLSLLKPNWMLAMLKDVGDVAEHLARWHKWDEHAWVKFLENDFSKFDKSQQEFCVRLKEHVYQQLGMNEELLTRWMKGQRQATLRAVALGIKLTVENQQRSGDGATSFANGIVNIISVAYAYRGTEVDCAAFVGDDSLVVARKIVATQESIGVLGQVFNLQSKFILPQFPYFCSHFFEYDVDARVVRPYPDPIKRAERWSVAVSAVADQSVWENKFLSQERDCKFYMRSGVWTRNVGGALRERYATTVSDADACEYMNAMATAVSSFEKFRALWEPEVSVLHRT